MHRNEYWIGKIIITKEMYSIDENWCTPLQKLFLICLIKEGAILRLTLTSIQLAENYLHFTETTLFHKHLPKEYFFSLEIVITV